MYKQRLLSFYQKKAVDLLYYIRQDKMSLLNDDAESNTPTILKTLNTSQDNILLNSNAAKSIFLISITPNMSQDYISLLNCEA